MIADSRRKTEVNIRDLIAEERKLMEEATDKEVDQWISNSVFKNRPDSWHTYQTHHGNEMDLDLERSTGGLKGKSTLSC